MTLIGSLQQKVKTIGIQLKKCSGVSHQRNEWKIVSRDNERSYKKWIGKLQGSKSVFVICRVAMADNLTKI